MATKLVKNYLMAIVAMVMVVGFSAFKMAENYSTNMNLPTNGWYVLDIQSNDPNDYNDPEKQLLTGAIETDPNGATCHTLFTLKPCAIHLEFTEEYVGPEIDGEDELSVDSLLTYEGVLVTTPTGSYSSYSRRNM